MSSYYRLLSITYFYVVWRTRTIDRRLGLRHIWPWTLYRFISNKLATLRLLNETQMTLFKFSFIARCTQCKARYCYRRSSVCPSVRLSVTLMYRGRIGWVTSKVIARIISLGSSHLGAMQHPRGTPPIFGWNRDGVAHLSKKPAISLKRGKIGLRLLSMTK